MAITAEQRNEVISLLVGMFDAAPSATLMQEFVDAMDAGATVASLADSFAMSDEFKSLYPEWLTDAEFATNFTTNLLDGNTSASDLTDAITAVTDLLATNSRGATANIAVDYLINTAGVSDAVYGTAVQALLNKVDVATYFATTQLDASSDLASLQAVVADVTSDATTVSNQKVLIDAGLDSLVQNLTVGQDDLTGSAGNDGFTAWIFNNTNSAQSGDMIDGGAGTDTLVAEIGDSQNFAISLKTTSVEVAEFRAQAQSTDSSDNDIQDGGTDGIDEGVQIDAQDMDGTVEFWSTDSRANLTIEDVRENSNTVTLGWRNTDAGDVNFETYFDTQHITAPSAVTADSQLFLELLDLEGMATDGEPLLNNPYIGVSFTLDGVTHNIEGAAVVQTSYADLVAGLNAALVDEGLSDVTASLGSSFSAINSSDGLSYDGTTIVLTNSGSETLGSGGWIVDGVLPPDSNLHTSQSTTPPATSTELTQVDVVFDNVGRGSKAEDFVAGNISQGTNSGSQGIQQFNIQIDRDSWVDTVRSTNNTLEEVYLESIGSEGTVRIDDLNDVRVFDATSMTNDVTLDATLADTVIAKYYDLEDDATNASADNIDFEYDTAAGDDTLDINVSEAAASYEDFSLTVTTGAGDDSVTLMVNDMGATLDTNWVADQEALDNIIISTGSGDDTVNTFGGGSATITTGSGDDTVYSDNSGINNEAATWLFNAANTDRDDILGTGEGNDYLLFNAQLTVTFSAGSTAAGVTAADAVALGNGFESTVTVPTSNYIGNHASINQGIKDAINNDAVLSKYLLAEDGPNHSLVVTSLVDGVYTADDLDVSIVAATLADESTGDQTGMDTAWETLGSDSTLVLAQGDLNAQVAAVVAAGTGFNGTSVLADDGTGIAEVLEVQTYDFNALNLANLDNLETITVTVDTATFTYTATGAETIDTIIAAFDGSTAGNYTVAGDTATDIVTVTQNVGFGAPIAQGAGVVSDGTVGAIAAATTADGVVFAAAGVTYDGVASDEEANDNIINVGTGTDVVALSTNVGSEETVVLTGTANGEVTILNFTAGGGAGADVLDLSAYLTTVISTSTSTESQTAVATTVTNVTGAAGNGAVDANEITVINDFTATATDTWAGLTATVLLAAVNDATNTASEDDYANIDVGTLDATAVLADIVGTTRDHVVMVENEANDGEYKVFTLTSTEGETDFASATLIGTVDLGDEVVFAATDFS